jgi:hypothetical protein
MAKGGRFAFFDQLSSREKGLLGGLSFGVFAVVVLFAWLWVQGTLGELEEEIELNAEIMADVEVAAQDFVGVKAKCDALDKLISSNPISSLRIPVNNIARGVSLQGGRKLSDEIGSLVQEQEQRLGPLCRKGEKGKRKKKKETDEAGVVKVAQDFEFKNIPVDSIFSFLEGLEKSKDLLFVTKLEIRRKFGDPAQAQSALVTVATYRMEQEAPK